MDWCFNRLFYVSHEGSPFMLDYTGSLSIRKYMEVSDLCVRQFPYKYFFLCTYLYVDVSRFHHPVITEWHMLDAGKFTKINKHTFYPLFKATLLLGNCFVCHQFLEWWSESNNVRLYFRFPWPFWSHHMCLCNVRSLLECMIQVITFSKLKQNTGWHVP